MDLTHEELLAAWLRGDKYHFSAAVMAAQSDVQWAELLSTADRHRVTPLLHGAITAANLQAALPVAVRQYLAETYCRTAVANTLLLHELGQLLAEFHRRSIASTLLKGPALALALYPDIATRPMRDIDLLVRRQDVRQVFSILIDRGYHAPAPGSMSNDHIRFENETLFVKDGKSPAMVDIHWHLFDSPFYQEDALLAWFWQTRAPLAIGAEATAMFAPVAQLLYLCGHFTLHHQAHGLLWLHDIAQLLRLHGAAVDWTLVWSQSRRARLSLALQHALTAVARDFPGVIPDAAWAAQPPSDATAAEQRIFAWRTASARPVAQRFWSDLRALPTWRARSRYIWIQIFPSAAYMRERYRANRPLQLAVSYPLRWLTGLRSAFGYLMEGR